MEILGPQCLVSIVGTFVVGMLPLIWAITPNGDLVGESPKMAFKSG